ncbi:MAG: glycoside hydrolase family 99-like domain-containing protein [Bacteroidales bacterium]|nr:glycoside hydrolase family 99-like domain-containing protein [Bacteroidales bacterium]
MSKPRLIAFYLPQFYPTPENDEWWGKGFTEWTNVGRAKPLFKGHYQPRVPADLGYYDLRIPEIRIQQAELAKEAGIEGFCYWHYWFAGQRLLDKVFYEVVETGVPDFPFCLCWANHSWKAKTWDHKIPDKMLKEQTYPGMEDYKNHFYAMLPAFKDSRYIKIGGKLLFGIFAPLDIPDFVVFKEYWNRLANENGLEGFHFFAYNPKPVKTPEIQKKNFDSVVEDAYSEAIVNRSNKIVYFFKMFSKYVLRRPLITKYSRYVKYCLQSVSLEENIFPCILPNYDHTPRSGRKGLLLHNSTPELWGHLLKGVIKNRQNVNFKKEDSNLIFIKSWNEWGEGNYMEPDLKYGKKYIIKTRQSIEKND